MLKLLDILTEGKQVGTLYHWTDTMSSYNIVNNNFLKGYLTDTFSSQPGISLTRNKNFSNYVIKVIIPKKRFMTSLQYSPDQYDFAFEKAGGEGYAGNIKYYVEWLNKKGFNNVEII